MPRFAYVFVVALFVSASMPVRGLAAASPSPAPTASAAVQVVNHDAGTIDGVVTAVDYTPGKSKMTVRAAAQTFVFEILAGTNVEGPSHDFAVDVKIGTHVAVSASKSSATYTAQIVHVLLAGHLSH